MCTPILGTSLSISVTLLVCLVFVGTDRAIVTHSGADTAANIVTVMLVVPKVGTAVTLLRRSAVFLEMTTFFALKALGSWCDLREVGTIFTYVVDGTAFVACANLPPGGAGFHLCEDLRSCGSS